MTRPLTPEQRQRIHRLLPPPNITIQRHTLTVTEAADVLGISVSLLYRLIREGTCPVPTIGTRRALRLPARLVQAWADGELVQATRTSEPIGTEP